VNEVLLALADDEHLMGHRHSEWVCVAPFLEEDLAFASIGQDELGHALALYDLLTDDVEHLALRRAPEEWRSCWLVELPCHTWEHALVRHWLYDSAERLRWEALLTSTEDGVAAVAARALREEDYHRRHASALVDRLLDGTAESREHVTTAIDELLPLGVALWEPVAGDDTTTLAAMWRSDIEDALRRHDVTVTWPSVASDLQAGRTRRSPHFDEIHDALTEVLRLDPAATW
jgi:ring-1,2-phenylacetyl-CoA epoxidase subunit PaaC